MEIIASNLQLHGVSRILANTGLHRVFLISLGISRIEYLQKGLIIMIYHLAPGTWHLLSTDENGSSSNRGPHRIVSIHVSLPLLNVHLIYQAPGGCLNAEHHHTFPVNVCPRRHLPSS